MAPEPAGVARLDRPMDDEAAKCYGDPLIARLYNRICAARRPDNVRPFVTLGYAQSIDGSIAARPGTPLAISGPGSARFSHCLRAIHDAILVGIGTVLADDPRLTVRLVAGPDPQTVVLDSRLRMPADARLLHGRASVRPWIAANPEANGACRAELEARGAVVLPVTPSPEGMIDLCALLHALFLRGVRSLLVEGGARVITSFLSARLIDHVAVTIAPLIVGGVRALEEGEPRLVPHPRLDNVTVERLGDDVVITGDPRWND